MVDASGKQILDSWKEIAHYLNREVRTCYRWQKDLGLPVYRIDNRSSRSKVFAYKSEIDQWLKERTRCQPLPGNGSYKKKWLIFGGLFCAVLLSIIAVAKMPAIFSPDRITSVAVLPLKNSNPSGNDDYLSEELSKAIAADLPVPKKLKVIPAFAVRGLLGGSADLKDLGKRLGAAYILRGVIEKANPMILVSVELVRTDDGAIVWKSQVRESFANTLAIPAGICNGIRKTLKIRGGIQGSDDGGIKDYRAVDSYLKGDFILTQLSQGNDDPWQFYHQGEYYSGRFTTEANEIAIKLFLQAAQIDPGFARAYIGLASCYANYVNFNWQFDVSWLNKAEELLKKAQTLTPDLPEYYSTLIEVKILKEACFAEDVWDSVAAVVAEGIKRYGDHPRLNSIVGYFYYKKYGKEGNEADFRRALEYKERSFWLSPYELGNIVYANLLMLNREFGKAIEVCKVLERLDATPMSKFLMGEISYYMGDLEGSQLIFEKLAGASLEYKIGALYYLAMIFARKGDDAQARSALKEIENISPAKFVYFEKDLRLASVWAGLGEKGLATKTLGSFLSNPAYRNDLHIYEKYVGLDDNFLELRQEETFKKLIDFKGENDGQKQNDPGHA